MDDTIICATAQSELLPVDDEYSWSKAGRRRRKACMGRSWAEACGVQGRGYIARLPAQLVNFYYYSAIGVYPLHTHIKNFQYMWTSSTSSNKHILFLIYQTPTLLCVYVCGPSNYNEIWQTDQSLLVLLLRMSWSVNLMYTHWITSDCHFCWKVIHVSCRSTMYACNRTQTQTSCKCQTDATHNVVNNEQPIAQFEV